MMDDDRALLAARIRETPVAACSQLLSGDAAQALGGIPPYMRPGLMRYVLIGVRPGSFLCAVLANDLFRATTLADDENVLLLQVYAKWLHQHAPASCYGSDEAITSWCGLGGLVGAIDCIGKM